MPYKLSTVTAIMISISLTACAPRLDMNDTPLQKLTPKAWKKWSAPDTSSYISWDTLNDPRLKQLLGRALINNLDIETARQRLKSSEISLRSQKSALYPSLSFNNNISYGGDLNTSRNNASFSRSIPASYEIDIWGRNSDRAKSAQHRVHIAKISLRSARISLAARVSAAYFNITALDRRLDLRRLSLQKAFELREFVKARFEGGLAVAMDLDRQDVQVADLQTAIEELKASRAASENNLAVLLGKTPEEFEFKKQNIPLTASKKLLPSAPIDILRARPDIQIAESSLAISHISYDLMRKRLYPTFSLSAAASLASNSLSTFFDVLSLPFRAAAGSSIPLFDGGRRQAEIDQASLSHKMVITNYKRTILNALRDVETALARQESIARQKESLERKRQSQEKVSKEAKARFEAGSISSINLLQDENALIRVQEQEVNLWLRGKLSAIGLLRVFGVDPNITQKKEPAS